MDLTRTSSTSSTSTYKKKSKLLNSKYCSSKQQFGTWWKLLETWEGDYNNNIMKEKLDGWEELNQHVRSVWCSELYVDHGDDGGGVGKGCGEGVTWQTSWHVANMYYCSYHCIKQFYIARFFFIIQAREPPKNAASGHARVQILYA